MMQISTQRFLQWNKHNLINKIIPPNNTIKRNASALSGLQKEVLALYRKLLRISHQKNSSQSFTASLSNPDSTTHAIRNKFRQKAGEVSKRDVNRIEYNIRQGEKYVKTLNMAGVKGMRSSN